MEDMHLNQIIAQIARKNRTTPQQIRSEMEAAMKEAMKNPDPVIQARWAAIPRKGSEITLEEFVNYCSQQLRNR